MPQLFKLAGRAGFAVALLCCELHMRCLTEAPEVCRSRRQHWTCSAERAARGRQPRHLAPQHHLHSPPGRFHQGGTSAHLSRRPASQTCCTRSEPLQTVTAATCSDRGYAGSESKHAGMILDRVRHRAPLRWQAAESNIRAPARQLAGGCRRWRWQRQCCSRCGAS